MEICSVPTYSDHPTCSRKLSSLLGLLKSAKSDLGPQVFLHMVGHTGGLLLQLPWLMKPYTWSFTVTFISVITLKRNVTRSFCKYFREHTSSFPVKNISLKEVGKGEEKPPKNHLIFDDKCCQWFT